MKERLEIGICGSGLFKAGIERSLRKQAGLWFSQLGESLQDATREIAMTFPQAVIFELKGSEQPEIAGLLRRHPGIRLVGVSPDTSDVTVFSASQFWAASADDLAQLLSGQPAAE